MTEERRETEKRRVAKERKVTKNIGSDLRQLDGREKNESLRRVK